MSYSPGERGENTFVTFLVNILQARKLKGSDLQLSEYLNETLILPGASKYLNSSYYKYYWRGGNLNCFLLKSYNIDNASLARRSLGIRMSIYTVKNKISEYSLLRVE